MKGNGYGSYKTNRYADMRAHDACPPRLRWAMNYSVADFSAQETLQMHRIGIPIAEQIRAMAAADRAETVETYGPSHPEAARD